MLRARQKTARTQESAGLARDLGGKWQPKMAHFVHQVLRRAGKLRFIDKNGAVAGRTIRAHQHPQAETQISRDNPEVTRTLPVALALTEQFLLRCAHENLAKGQSREIAGGAAAIER